MIDFEKWSRLARCITKLGPWLGFRYWRLQQRAKKNPGQVWWWITLWREEADKAEAAGDRVFADALREFCDDVEERLVAYSEAC